MKIFYHNDADGQCSAALVREYFLKPNHTETDMTFIPMNTYEDKIDFNSIMHNERIFILDYSIKPDDMRRILMKTPVVVWIDHHKTAIEMYMGFSFVNTNEDSHGMTTEYHYDSELDIMGIREDGTAACELTCRYLYGKGSVPGYVKLVGDRDVWKWKYGDRTRNFCAGLRLYDCNPGTTLRESVWYNLSITPGSTYVDHICKKGAVLIQADRIRNEEYLKRFAFECEFCGYKALAVNIGGVGSDFFESADLSGYDLTVAYTFKADQYSYSLRSTKIDVSEVAKKFGGGGHKGAAGFTSPLCLVRHPKHKGAGSFAKDSW